ncbi:S9 family peptidase [Polymorphum gilvum]|uniref:Esterase/lipase/thioesterase, active site:Prolyl oligopeptidase:Prolyl oligopeptidase serine protease n=1 Tax=Polymorphum gilvum (strain LMG 25793 / CGMCC 1.9160 / SL003B-26A1) TaxID=991905 RepID=F2IV61_POLGS|nr:S9 family peptidase [Polymorphum gilvum]ADZ71391.1 Esterase/lipase/thioesterase, active site:Prolyl oligopeptidase:Prolyl oligopeptidase serine protease [Polymorphum gilvum SL003B-26A1]
MTKTVLPPRAVRRPVTHEIHGVTRTDDYAWLRADNWQEVMRDGRAALADDIEAYLDAENAYLDHVMAPTAALQERLFTEMKGRIKEDDSSVPSPDGPYAYGLRYVAGGQHPKLTRTPRDGGAEEILVDGDQEAEGKAYFRLGGAEHSPDHKRLAWAFDDKGSEFYALLIRDLETGKDLDHRIEDTAGGGVFSADGRYLFYVRLDASHRPSKLFRHEVGTDPAGDVLVFEERDPGFFMGVGKTQSGSHIVIDIHDHETSEVWTIPAGDPLAEPALIAARETAQQYSVEENGGTFYILTNAGDAEDFKIVTAPVESPGRGHWHDLVPHVPGRLILSHTLYKDFMIRLEREDGLPRIVIRRLVDNIEHAIAFDEEAYSLGLSDGYEFDTSTIRFTYSSMTTPSRVYDYDVETRKRMLRKEQEVPSGHDPAAYVTRRLQAPARDGETVPVSILYRRDTPLDGSAPCLLYGYGSYGIAIPAAFSTNALSLVDRGFVYAIAHIRGGKEKGYRWYKDGRREKKVNTFTDFIAAAEHLVAEGFTRHDRIVAHGGSAGGMLVGAVANMAPDRFAGIIGEVPFVDVLNTMLDDTLPLTPPEWPEWGNPGASPAAFRTIASYSPYDNVAPQAYPAILAVGGLTDPRVTYWEPAKWVAKLRATKTCDNPLLLKTNMDAGHGGASGRFDRLKEVALVQAFALMVTGRT